MTEKITIVVPIYNLEKYLDKCLDSIKSQSYKDFEVLLIDDGSTDNSKEICDFYVNEDFRFKYFYQKNSGVSKARNLGLKNAQGKFITFIDGDDFLHVDHLKNMVDGMNYGQLAISGRNNIYQNKVQDSFKEDKDIVLDKKQLIDEILKPGIIYSFPWNKMYLTKIIRDNQITFDESLDYGEDLVFNMEYLLKVDGGVLKKNATYNYVYRKNSVSRMMSKKTLQKRVTDIFAIKRTIQMLPPDFMVEKNFLYKRIIVEGARYFRLMVTYQFDRAFVDDYKAILNTSYKKIKANLNLKEKIIFLMNMRAPKLVFYLKNKI